MSMDLKPARMQHLKVDLVLHEDQHFYFVYDKFYDELKRGDWNQERARTATMIKQYFKGEFDCQKRFPKGDNEESFPPLRVLKLPKRRFRKRRDTRRNNRNRR